MTSATGRTLFIRLTIWPTGIGTTAGLPESIRRWCASLTSRFCSGIGNGSGAPGSSQALVHSFLNSLARVLGFAGRGGTGAPVVMGGRDYVAGRRAERVRDQRAGMVEAPLDMRASDRVQPADHPVPPLPIGGQRRHPEAPQSMVNKFS